MSLQTFISIVDFKLRISNSQINLFTIILIRARVAVLRIDHIGHGSSDRWLFYVAERQLFCVLTGECGTGKTTAVRRFKEELDPSKYTMMYVADSKLTHRNFYKGILDQLGAESKFYRGDAKRQLHKEIELMKGLHKKQPVVVVDEAHLLDREMLEEVRFLLNFKMDAISPMALILVGQVELWDKLQMRSYTAISQRIDIQCKIQPMDHSQVREYLRCHLNYAGTDRDIFTDEAIEMIYRFSGGSSRLVNKVCTSSLIYGCQNGKRIIDDHMVKIVINGELS